MMRSAAVSVWWVLAVLVFVRDAGAQTSRPKVESGSSSSEWTDLPEAARAGIQREYAQFQFDGFKRTGKVKRAGDSKPSMQEAELFEVTGRTGDVRLSLSVDAEGSIHRRAEEVAGESVPALMAAAAEAAAKPAGFTIRKGRRVVQKGVESYEVDATCGPLLYQIRLGMNGDLQELRAARQQGIGRPPQNKDTKPEKRPSAGETAPPPPPVDWK
jgi:hypothetical protein